MSAFHLATEFAALSRTREPRILSDFRLDSTAMLGVIRIEAGSTDGSWERHDGGDELLVILKGHVRFRQYTARGETQQFELRAGDVLFNPRGVAHGGEVLEDLEILFITAREGNHEGRGEPIVE